VRVSDAHYINLVSFAESITGCAIGSTSLLAIASPQLIQPTRCPFLRTWRHAGACDAGSQADCCAAPECESCL